LAAENSTASRFYNWQVPGKPVLVYLSFGVMERIAQEAVRALGSIPRRGAEVGGLLLGSAQSGDRAVVKIVDCLPVPCGHYFGPSYILTQEEKRTCEQVLARWQPLPSRNIYAVGYYRSHTRDELFLSDEDVWLMSNYFAEPSRVALLVKPRITTPSVGGFFFWEDGRIHCGASYLEFPFDRRALGVAPAEPEEEVPAAAAEAVTAVESEAAPETTEAELPPAAPLPEPAVFQPEPAAPAQQPESVPLPSFLQAPQRADRQGRSWGWKAVLLWIPVLMALVLLGGWLGTQGARYLPLGWPSRTPADPYALGLAVTEYGDNLHLTWNRDAPALREAERGLLIIGDGEQSRTMELDAVQLRNGSVIYRRVSGPVRFRLELFLKGGRALSEGWEPLATKPAATVPAQ
jgi:hypothetical protein